MDTQLLDCLFEMDNLQQDWEELDEENGRDQGPTIVTAETHAAGEISSLFLTLIKTLFVPMICY